MKTRKSKIKVSNANTIKPKKNLTLIGVLAVIIVVIAAVIFFGLSRIFKTSTYYVLRDDVSAKTQITTNMLVGQTTSAGTEPKNALSIQQVQSGNLYAKYPLEKGDVISKSNVGALKQSTAGIPDDWVVTSFQSNSDDSVDGRIERGTYFDIIGIDDDGNARYLFTDVLALDVTSNASGDSKDSGSAYDYTIGMPQEDAPLLHGAIKKYNQIKLVLSPKSVDYKKRDTTDLGKVQHWEDSEPDSKDLHKGTDSTFKAVKRDKHGKPVKSKKSSKTSDNTEN